MLKEEIKKKHKQEKIKSKLWPTGAGNQWLALPLVV